MVNWSRVDHYFEFFVASFSFGLNFLVIYLCLYRISRAMRTYRAMLIFGCVVDSCSTLVFFVTQVVVVDHKTQMVFLLDSPFLPPTHTSALLAAILFCIAVWAIVVNVSTQFVNRYNMICLDSKYSLKHIIGFFFLFFTWPVLHCVLSMDYVLDLHDDPQTIRELRELSFFRDSGVPPYISGDTRTWRMFLELMDVQLMAATSYTITIYCGLKIRKKLREDRRKLQPATTAMQKQLTRILTFQAAIPLVSVFLPIGLADGFPLFNISFPGMAVFAKVTVNVAPLLNPLVVLLTIPRFRAIFFHLPFLKSRRLVEPTASDMTSDRRIYSIH